MDACGKEKRSIFESSIFEATYDQLKVIEKLQEKTGRKTSKRAKCPLETCDWTGSKQGSFRKHVQRKHTDMYQDLHGIR
jgi:hypothetical protein